MAPSSNPVRTPLALKDEGRDALRSRSSSLFPKLIVNEQAVGLPEKQEVEANKSMQTES